MKFTARQWKKLTIWGSAYVNILAYVLVGGYFMIKDDDERVKKSVKYAFLVSLAFTVCSILLNAFSYVGYGLNWSFTETVCRKWNNIMNFSRYIVYPLCAVIDIFFGKKEKVEEKQDGESTKEA